MLPQYKTIYDYIEQYIQMIKTVFIERGICEDLYLQIIYFIDIDTMARNNIATMFKGQSICQ